MGQKTSPPGRRSHRFSQISCPLRLGVFARGQLPDLELVAAVALLPNARTPHRESAWSLSRRIRLRDRRTTARQKLLPHSAQHSAGEPPLKGFPQNDTRGGERRCSLGVRLLTSSATGQNGILKPLLATHPSGTEIIASLPSLRRLCLLHPTQNLDVRG